MFSNLNGPLVIRQELFETLASVIRAGTSLHAVSIFSRLQAVNPALSGAVCPDVIVQN